MWNKTLLCGSQNNHGFNHNEIVSSKVEKTSC